MQQNSHQQALSDTIRALSPTAGHPALVHITDTLHRQYGTNLVAVLFYGSCLRGGDPYEGLVDLYVIVDSYRKANDNLSRTFLNHTLPPNVFYAEFLFEQRTVRSKYGVLSCRDLLRGTSSDWYHSYLWGRLSQPTAIAWSRDDHARACVEKCLRQSVLTFLDRTLPALPEQGSLLSLWTGGLALSYGSELRPETPGRAEELVRHYSEYYHQVTAAATPLLAWPLKIQASEHYQVQITPASRLVNRFGWKIRGLQGKLLSIARLTKTLFTFTGALDYLIWKLERHSGQSIEVPDRLRRHPLIFAWGFLWRLYRRGIFR